ncbi:MAG TPA: hypothetical protein VN911_14635 [Candidatus Acidoferrum sp.]|nr:hypothetical protein [Candidatus Acidoferrum sp.]
MSSALRDRIKHFLKRLLLVAFSAVFSIGLIGYAVDYVAFRYRVATNRQPFGQFTINSYDAVLQKNGKTEFIFNPPEPQTCVHALFPHAGFVPCWYLQRHTEPRTNI